MWHQNNFPFGSLSKNIVRIEFNLILFYRCGGGGRAIKSPFDPKDDVTFLNSTPQQINASNINL